MNEFIATVETWWIVNDGVNIHHGKLQPGLQVNSMYDINTYTDETEWVSALGLLGITLETNEEPQVGE